MINIDQFKQVEISVGLVTAAENVEGSEKLIRLHVSLSQSLSLSENERTIFTGVRGYGYTAEDFVGKKFLFVTNLEPKKIMEEESQGMILAVGEEKPVFVSAENLPVGARVR